MLERYEKPLHVAKTDTYTVTVNAAWLGIETLSTVAVTTAGAGVTIGAVTKLDNVIQAELTGVTVGTHELEFSWVTSASRSDCVTVAIIVRTC
jgi:hypothetical protein